jgi:hypothetical protein
MASASSIARLREVLQQGLSGATTAFFAGGFLFPATPPRADGVVIFPDSTQAYVTGIRLGGDPADLGILLNPRAPTVVCMSSSIFLFSPGSSEPIGLRWFRLQ